ncbi:MAG: class I SAM-dependent methyltransferase [Tenacibaculum sp.]|nr:class I SAM-dependent methyltransferase [Tenacibaculum sp.]
MKTYKNWTKEGSQAEQEMEDGHIKEWRNIINELQPDDFVNYSILDFGCNQGAFLKHLYKDYPFNKAVGIDLSCEAIKTANSRKENFPINYYTTEEFRNNDEKFDIVISNSVLFFIKDLAEHAKQIKSYLKDKGIYYINFCDFMKSSNIASIKEKIDSWAETPLVLHSLDEIVKVFSEEGFDVEVKRLRPSHFIPLKYNDEWYVNVSERLQINYENRYLFRIVKQ